jgi:alkanesulfonate monooxygenase SsuD/methylene tetrahydromethanopterin reductase-like flavin-dependent oxidoreductase (luciferase family)
MDVGLGLPITDPDSLSSWARLADEGPFGTLSVLDRLVYDSPDPLVTLAFAAGCTRRVRLQTGVLVAPLRQPVVLAKQVATLDRLSGGRLVLGLGVGRRADDYAAAGVGMAHRGALLDQQLAIMQDVWKTAGAGGPGSVGPAPGQPSGPPILFGGFAPAAIDRVGRFGHGYHCAASPADTARLFEAVRTTWRDRGRAGRPRLVAQVNVVLGDDAVMGPARDAIRAYHAYLGDVAVEIARQAIGTAHDLRGALAAFGDIGADELIVACWSADLDQFARIADVVS